jgi:hypothetical protein
MKDSVSGDSSKPVHAAAFYVGHLYIVGYLLTGISVQGYYFLKNGGFRILSVATWPWILSGSGLLLLLSSLAYLFALLAIARSFKSRLADVEVTWYTMLPYILYVFVWFAMTGRLFVYYISPEGMFYGN